jgi:hypothetical protein
VEKQDKTFGGVNQVQELARKLRENKSSLHIARIPEKTRKLFIAIADEEFCSDYGMLVKFLLDKVVAGDTKAILKRLDEQDERIKELEDKKEESTIKTLSGKKIK